MRMYDIIQKKRDGNALSEAEIQWVMEKYVAGEIPDYQVAALCMAIYFQGMSLEETTALTFAVRDSGERLDFSDIKGIRADKHSTGGVGDKTSLVVTPIVATLGVKVAKMSGRGLGHTGGTATCVAQAVCAHCGTSYGELGGHSFDSDGNCTGCRIRAKAYLGAYDFELNQYVITYYETLPEALAAVPHGTSYVGALANYDGDFVINVVFYPNGHTFSGDITVNKLIHEGGNFTGKVTINSGDINEATFDGEVIVKGDIGIPGAIFNNTVTFEENGEIWGWYSKFYKTVTNNGTIGGGEPEYRAIRHAKANAGAFIQEYALNRAAANGLDMICGGTIKLVFIPLD